MSATTVGRRRKIKKTHTKGAIFLYISVRKFLFQRRKILSGGKGRGWGWGFKGRLNNFLKAAPCLGLSAFRYFDL